MRRWAELRRSWPQPVVDDVERFDQLVVPWIVLVEQGNLRLPGFDEVEQHHAGALVRQPLAVDVLQGGHCGSHDMLRVIGRRRQRLRLRWRAGA